MKSKTIFLLIFLIFVLIVIFVLKNNAQEAELNNPPEQINKLNETPPSQIEIFRLISTNLNDRDIGINESIKIEFNKPVSSEFIYVIEPQINVKIIIGNDNEIVIEPVDAWVFDTNYTLKILKSTLSTTYQTLDKEYIYTFQTPPYSGI